MNRQQIKAWAVIVTLLVICFGTIIFFSDVPIASASKRNTWGAIAIRDNVIPFQKVGTALFTRNYLYRYAESYYYTQNEYDQHHPDFVNKLTKLLKEQDSVDIYLLAHTNYYYEWVSEVDSSLRKKIHLVYNTGCSGTTQCDVWKKLGVRYYVCHKSNVSISPVFYFYFLRRYLGNYSLRKAIKESNAFMHSRLGRIRMASFGSVAVQEQVEKESEGVLCVNP
jgi:hypothetical protein